MVSIVTPTKVESIHSIMANTHTNTDSMIAKQEDDELFMNDSNNNIDKNTIESDEKIDNQTIESDEKIDGKCEKNLDLLEDGELDDVDDEAHSGQETTTNRHHDIEGGAEEAKQHRRHKKHKSRKSKSPTDEYEHHHHSSHKRRRKHHEKKRDRRKSASGEYNEPNNEDQTEGNGNYSIHDESSEVRKQKDLEDKLAALEDRIGIKRVKKKNMDGYLSEADENDNYDESSKSSKFCPKFLLGKCHRTPSECYFRHPKGISPTIMELCKYYAMSRCAKRLHCPYLHKGFPCKHYHALGECRKSVEECKYSHEPLENDTRNMLIRHLECAPVDILKGDDFHQRFSHDEAYITVLKIECVHKKYDKHPQDSSISASGRKSANKPAKSPILSPNNMKSIPPPTLMTGFPGNSLRSGSNLGLPPRITGPHIGSVQNPSSLFPQMNNNRPNLPAPFNINNMPPMINSPALIRGGPQFMGGSQPPITGGIMGNLIRNQQPPALFNNQRLNFGSRPPMVPPPSMIPPPNIVGSSNPLNNCDPRKPPISIMSQPKNTMASSSSQQHNMSSSDDGGLDDLDITALSNALTTAGEGEECYYDDSHDPSENQDEDYVLMDMVAYKLRLQTKTLVIDYSHIIEEGKISHEDMLKDPRLRQYLMPKKPTEQKVARRDPRRR